MKKILVFSAGPIFCDHVHGGSQKVLRDLACFLGARGHRVSIYCVKRPDNDRAFDLAPRVRVYPLLPFRETFPASYRTSPFRLWRVMQILDREIQHHDVFYIHDANLNLFELCQRQIPTVVSFRDLLYPETLVGAFNVRRDEILVNSRQTYDCVRHTIGNVLPDIASRMTIINNGIDVDRFSRVTPRRIYDLIDGIVYARDTVLLYPHRPDPAKGIAMALRVVARLKAQDASRRLKLLVPRYLDENVTDDLQGYYDRVWQIARQLGIVENVLFHDWVPYDLMPEYYSLGTVTLSLGNFIEGFGSNVALESLACGTPVVMSRVAAQRNTMPDHLVAKVDYGNVRTAVTAVQRVLDGRAPLDTDAVRAYLRGHFSYEQMLGAYEERIVGAAVRRPLRVSYARPSALRGTLRMAPWCCVTGRGLYDDYLYGERPLSPALRRILQTQPTFTYRSLSNVELRKEVQALFEVGAIVPMRDDDEKITA